MTVIHATRAGQDLKDAAPADSLTLDSAILGEQFYFFTVVLMWLIHVGFMTYETGVARRKNALATAMKNILTIAVVTPTFYYFGWWIYNCNQAGLPIGPNSSDFTSVACQSGIPWSDTFGPNLTNNINLVFFLAFLLFSWTTASIMSGALLERVRLSAYLVLACLLGSVVWILDAAWGWSAGGWMTLRFGFHDSIASAVVHGVSGRLHARGALQPRAANREVHEGRPDPDLQTSQRAYDADGADADLHRVLRLLRRLPGDRLDHVPRLGEHLPEPDHAGLDRDDHHDGIRGRLHRRLLRQPRGPVLDRLGRPRRRDQRLGRRRRLRADARLSDLDADAPSWWSTSGPGSRRRCGSTTPSGAVAVHGFSGFLGIIWVGVFAAGYPTGLNNVESSYLAADDRRRDLPAARLPLGLGRVLHPEEAQPAARAGRRSSSTGLDSAEYEPDIHVPEFARGEDLVIEPDGTRIPARALQEGEYAALHNGGPPRERPGART